ncbi:MAG: hypothetical protein LBE65_01850 [Synergistaceae bacterium]|jgi:hypothetical protein|nr:hypothetical protein [Synergistaceae bacterium]
MSRFEFVSCRLAIQVCIGYFPDGRERHRTFSLKNIRPDADPAALITVVRAIGSLLAYPVTHARLIVKKRRVLFDATKPDMTAWNAAPDVPNTAPETRGGTPKMSERETKPRGSANSVFAKSAELTKTFADVPLFFKNFKKFRAFFARFAWAPVLPVFGAGRG